MTRHPAPSVSVVIPVYGRRVQLELLLRSIAAQRDLHCDLEVVVVENQAPLNRPWLESLRVPFPLRYAFVPERGAARSRNVGAGLAAGDQILFVDSDIRLTSTAIADLAADLSAGAMVMADVRAEPRRDRTLATHLYDVPAHFRRYRAQPVLTFRDFLTCCFLTHRETFESTGGFDEGFVHYGYEDTELALRAENAGVRFALASARVYHHKHLDPPTVLDRATQLGRTAVHFVRRHPDIEDRFPVGVRDTVSGRLSFPTDFEIDALLTTAQRVEQTIADLRRTPSLHRARAALLTGREAYLQINLFGLYRGIVSELSASADSAGVRG